MFGGLWGNLLWSEGFTNFMKFILEIRRVHYEISALVVIFILARECMMHNAAACSDSAPTKEENV